MTKLYLITGFLGAGKTTFLHQFVRLFPDRRTAIVVNEFGKQGVDGTLLEDLDIKIEEITKGIIPCLLAELVVLLLITYIPSLSLMFVG